MNFTVDMAAVHGKLDRAWDAVLPGLTEQVLKDCEPFTPRDQGVLIASAQTASDFSSGKIIWNTPYARYLWFGLLMLAPNGSSWARPGEVKHSTKTALVYDTSISAEAGPLWAIRAQSRYYQDWLKIAQKGMRSP